MINLFDKEEFTESDIQLLIDNEIEENIYLDFKSAESLGKSDAKKKELSKDVAAFANSDGGIIIYGIQEKEHKAFSLSFINGSQYTKEWLEQIINMTIQRHIQGLRIFPIRFDSNFEKTVYVVKIPRSTDTPHMSKDKRFYKRFDFESLMMEEYEVRQLYERKSKSLLQINDYSTYLFTEEHKDFDEKLFKFNIIASIINVGQVSESEYKLNLYFDNFNENVKVSYYREEANFTRFVENNRIKIATSNPITIYPEEKVDAINVTFLIEMDRVIETLKNMNMELRMFYPNGDDKMEIDFEEIIDDFKHKIL